MATKLANGYVDKGIARSSTPNSFQEFLFFSSLPDPVDLLRDFPSTSRLSQGISREELPGILPLGELLMCHVSKLERSRVL